MQIHPSIEKERAVWRSKKELGAAAHDEQAADSADAGLAALAGFVLLLAGPLAVPDGRGRR